MALGSNFGCIIQTRQAYACLPFSQQENDAKNKEHASKLLDKLEIATTKKQQRTVYGIPEHVEAAMVR